MSGDPVSGDPVSGDPVSGNPPEAAARSSFLAFAIYTGSRIVIFGGTLAVLYAIGLRGFLVLIVALALSGIASYILLRRQRDVFAAAIEARVSQRRAAHEARLAAEDAAYDATYGSESG
jgi:hypothetical protein